MQIRLLIAVCFVLFWSEEVYAEPGNDVKRGAYPFMAFVYYPDETVVDATGARFIRAASLITPEWLISSAIDHSELDGIPLGFPRKTLLARLGAITIDANLTLNEDEDEQEREVIQIARPKQHSVELWWISDITLLKVLLPYKLTSAVFNTNINLKRDYTEKNCIVLVYAKKYGNNTNYKVLVQFSVELLPPSIDNCGSQFTDASMTCGGDNEEAKLGLYEPDFCVGNSGGPLICEGELVGVQTYIENNCKLPHLYTLLSPWKKFISCGTHDQCGNEEVNCNICSVTLKDAQPTSSSEPSPEVQFTGSSPALSSQIESESVETTEHVTLITLGPTETITEESEGTSTTAVVSEAERTSSTLAPPTVTSSMVTTTESPTVVYMATTNMTYYPNTTIESVATTSTTETTTTTVSATESRKHWPSEKSPSSNIKKLDESEDTKRQPKVEAQQQNEVKDSKVGKQQKYTSNAATHRNLNLFRIFFAFLIFACNI